MDRRELLSTGAGIIAGMSTARVALANPKDPHAAHKAEKKNNKLFDAAMNCQKTGQACLEHSLLMMSKGDSSLLECINSTRDMLAVTETLAKLAASSSPHLRGYASMAAQVCLANEKLCAKHAKEHVECRECADSCKKTAALCTETVAALDSDSSKG
jgi:Cys-rich four helix bundle protein (predicted Tat secretion target)